ALAAPAAAAPSPAGPLRFPREHFPHAGVGIEWWYFTGLVSAPGSPRFAYFFTLFRSGRGFLAVSNVVDLASGRTVDHTERVGYADAPPGRLDVRAAGAWLRYARGLFSFAVGSLALVERPLKPYVPNGTA